MNYTRCRHFKNSHVAIITYTINMKEIMVVIAQYGAACLHAMPRQDVPYHTVMEVSNGGGW